MAAILSGGWGVGGEMSLHTEAWTKGYHCEHSIFKYVFMTEIFYQNFTAFYSYGFNWHEVVCQVMAWHGISIKQLPEPVATKVFGALWHGLGPDSI